MGRYSDDQIKRTAINETTAASNAIVAAVAGKIIRVLEFSLIVAGASTMTWEHGTTDIAGPVELAANGEWSAK